jgi:hypothetical protein
METEVGRLCSAHAKGSDIYKIPVTKLLEK